MIVLLIIKLAVDLIVLLIQELTIIIIILLSEKNRRMSSYLNSIKTMWRTSYWQYMISLTLFSMIYGLLGPRGYLLLASCYPRFNLWTSRLDNNRINQFGINSAICKMNILVFLESSNILSQYMGKMFNLWRWSWAQSK